MKGKPFTKDDPRIDRRGRKKTYSQEVINFISENSGAMSDTELCLKINRLFNLSTSRQSVKSLRRYYKIIKGREKYKPYPALTERTDCKGYVKIKNAAGKWVYKHTYLWEQAHGKAPKGYIVIFLDGGKDNFSPENLALVTREEQMRLSKLKLRFTDPAFTQTGIAIVKHRSKIRARKGSVRADKLPNNSRGNHAG
jgi:hypothetical protein